MVKQEKQLYCHMISGEHKPCFPVLKTCINLYERHTAVYIALSSLLNNVELLPNKT